MAEYILQTFGLTKRYGYSTAVNNVNMKIKKGDIYEATEKLSNFFYLTCRKIKNKKN